MSPAVQRGDLIIAEGATYLFRRPNRGEIVVFKTDGILGMPTREQGQTYIMRLVGLPGDVVRVTNGHLFINDESVALRNEAGEITYTNFPTSRYLQTGEDSVTVPPDSCFVLGDNSPDSWDSRFWGFVPAENVRGRPFVRYGPPPRIGRVR